jgi:ribosomal protein S18 acetylase RimI-like enzyme
VVKHRNIIRAETDKGNARQHNDWKYEMQPDIRLDTAEKNDLRNLVSIISKRSNAENEQEFGYECRAKALISIMWNPDIATLYVIRDGEQTIGMLIMHLLISAVQGGRCGCIESLYIPPEYRNPRSGRQVTSHIKAIAAEKGLKQVTLIVDKSEAPAIEFYKSCGFKDTSRSGLELQILDGQ